MSRTRGMGGHESAKSLKVEWLTPPEIIRALGCFDLDPCAPSDDRRPWNTAIHHYCIYQDGLRQKWHGRVWMNPPYGRETGLWLQRLADHGNGVALIFARTETDMFFSQVWGKADAVLFLRRRLHFHHVCGTRAKGNAGAPSCLVAYGEENVSALQDSGLSGHLVILKQNDPYALRRSLEREHGITQQEKTEQ